MHPPTPIPQPTVKPNPTHQAMERDLARLQQAALLSAAGAGSLSGSTSGTSGGDTGGACVWMDAGVMGVCTLKLQLDPPKHP